MLAAGVRMVGPRQSTSSAPSQAAREVQVRHRQADQLPPEAHRAEVRIPERVTKAVPKAPAKECGDPDRGGGGGKRGREEEGHLSGHTAVRRPFAGNGRQCLRIERAL